MANKVLTEGDVKALTQTSTTITATRGCTKSRGITLGLTFPNNSISDNQLITEYDVRWIKLKRTNGTEEIYYNNSNIFNGYDASQPIVQTEMDTTIAEVYFGPGINEIARYSFYNCTNLTSVVFYGKNIVINKYAFQQCNLQNGQTWINVPNNILIIKGNSFYHTDIKSYNLPNSITSIQGHAIRIIDDSVIQFNSIIPPDLCDDAGNVTNNIGSITSGTIWSGTYLTLDVPSASLQAYKNKYTWTMSGSNVISQIIWLTH